MSAPIVRGHEIAIEDAVVLGPEPRDVLRYIRGVDLVALATLAPRSTDIPLLFEQYVASHGEVPLPEFLAALSLLTSRGVLHADVRTPLARPVERVSQSMNVGAGLPPSLKLRRTAEALAEAGQTRPRRRV